MATTEEIRSNVVTSLPEAAEIKNTALREKVYDAWTLALEKNNYARIEEMDHSGRPGMFFSKKLSQAEHLRGVARMAAEMAKAMQNLIPDFNVDMDEVIAGGLCHDLGKPAEYNPENRKRWADNPGAAGKPGIRHTFYGYYIAMIADLPESISHIAAMHSAEGEIVNRSVAAEIIRWADDGYWHILLAAGLVERGTPK